jgi:nucleotide-binding universal stress UspA family protein
MIKSILVPAVGLVQAEQTIEFAAVLAEPNAATVYFLHVGNAISSGCWSQPGQ